MPLLRAIGRGTVTLAVLLLVWQIVVMASGVPAYLLPAPSAVALAWWARAGFLLLHAGITLGEILLGLTIGTMLGALVALCLMHFRPARRWVLPLIVVSQALPVFALAPLLVLWFGYGMASKVAMAVLIIFFPVTAAFYDGLRRTDPGWLDLGRTMTAGRPDAARALLWHISVPAALPACASGLRVAAAVAPIGAVIGEWVGASAGLGFVMLQANARMQIDLMFAALITLGLIAVALYFAVDAGLRRAVPWQADSLSQEQAS